MVEGQSGGEPRRAGDVERLLADLADAPADDLSDLGGVDAGARHQLALDGAEQGRRDSSRRGQKPASTLLHGRGRRGREDRRDTAG